MSKLNIDQKTVYGLFSDRKIDFLIPDLLLSGKSFSLHIK